MAHFVADTDPNKADASPTKRFFVDIITRDIQLDEAIQDLVDNCVDGAKRLRPGPEDNYNDLWVKLEVGKTHFSIDDNCGGIPLEIARHYAFKFGRSKNFAATPGSVGQFGVGMKRALFKMAERFIVRSVEPNASFTIDVDVDAWSNDDINWDFDISDLIEGPMSSDELGTSLQLPALVSEVADAFDDAFVSELRQDIRSKQQHAMRNGLQIFLNNELIIPTEWQLKNGAEIAPSYQRFEDDLGGESLLITRLYAGIGSSSRPHAGWYVFCNGRCILEADQEKTTGWSAVGEDGVGIPKYHGQFARFRGYAFLDADDASILPWNTTKTGLDLESSAYRLLLQRLIEITRPVITFLNALDAEKDLDETDRLLTKAVDTTPASPLERIPARQAFTYTPPAKRGPPMTTISYKKPRNDVEKLRRAMNAAYPKHVGEQSFDMAYEDLVGDE